MLDCPLCGKGRVNPAALPSGYVFCYACVFEWVEERGGCPVTGERCGVEDIRKIYTAA